MKLIATKKQAFFKEKISISIGKPKELWESLTYLGMLNKTRISNFNVIEDNDTLTFDTRAISTVFKNFFSTLAESLLTEFPNPLDKYNLESNCNSRFTISDGFYLNNTSEDKVLKIILKIQICKATSVDMLSERFLRDGAEVLSRPVKLSLMLGKLQN